MGCAYGPQAKLNLRNSTKMVPEVEAHSGAARVARALWATAAPTPVKPPQIHHLSDLPKERLDVRLECYRGVWRANGFIAINKPWICSFCTLLWLTRANFNLFAMCGSNGTVFCKAKRAVRRSEKPRRAA